MVFLGAVAVMLASCRDFSFSSFVRGDALATVGEKELYMEDIQGLFTAGIAPEDSLKLLNSYVDLWVKQQLKMREAEKTSPEDEERIARMVDDYRNSLLIYGYERAYIDQRLDTVVTDEEINNYYQAHSEEFKLSVSLVKGLVARFPVGFRQEGQVRVMASSGNPERLKDVVDICIKNNFAYCQFSDWTDVAEVTAFLPRLSAREHARMLSASPLFEVTQGEERYFVVVTGLLREGAPEPVGRASETIRTMIVTRRKQGLLRHLEDSLYRTALAAREASIRVDTLKNTNEQEILEE